MNANDILIADIIKTTHAADVERAAAQLHTLTGWLACADVVIVDRARLEEARLTVVDNG